MPRRAEVEAHAKRRNPRRLDAGFEYGILSGWWQLEGSAMAESSDGINQDEPASPDRAEGADGVERPERDGSAESAPGSPTGQGRSAEPDRAIVRGAPAYAAGGSG